MTASMPERELRDAVGQAVRKWRRPHQAPSWAAMPERDKEIYREIGDNITSALCSLGMEIVRRDEGKERP